MIRHKFPISRRTVLRGAGVSLALPWLEAMMPASAGASAKADLPVRMAFLYMPNGVNTSAWAPEGSGRDFKLSATLQPLNDFKLIFYTMQAEVVHFQEVATLKTA